MLYRMVVYRGRAERVRRLAAFRWTAAAFVLGAKGDEVDDEG